MHLQTVEVCTNQGGGPEAAAERSCADRRPLRTGEDMVLRAEMADRRSQALGHRAGNWHGADAGGLLRTPVDELAPDFDQTGIDPHGSTLRVDLGLAETCELSEAQAAIAGQ